MTIDYSTMTIGTLQMRAAQLLAQRGAVKLEQRGMHNSRGDITPKLKRFYGLSRQAKHDVVIAAIEAELGQIAKALGVQP